MTCNNIYNAALALIGEAEDTDATVDYAVRSVNLLKVIFSRFARLSEELSGTEAAYESLNIASLDAHFPLDERLASLVSEVLASMLIIDELPDVSQMLAERAEFDRRQICADATAVSSTREVYGL